MTELAKRNVVIEKKNDDTMADTMVTMIMMMMMLMMMSGMMSSMFAASTTTTKKSEVGGLNWNWVIEGSETKYSGTFAGESVLPYEGSETKQWYSGTASSGNTGADLLDIGESTNIYKVYALDVAIGGLTPGANVTVRMYKQVNGYENEFYNYMFVVGTDSDNIPLIDSVTVFFGNLRIEIQSDTAIDDGTIIDYGLMVGVPA